MPKVKVPRYVVHCGDADLYFKYGKLVSGAQVQKAFERRIKLFGNRIDSAEFFPGLVLRDAQGGLWKPEIVVEREPGEDPVVLSVGLVPEEHHE
jgi:hypothetical protein